MHPVTTGENVRVLIKEPTCTIFHSILIVPYRGEIVSSSVRSCQFPYKSFSDSVYYLRLRQENNIGIGYHSDCEA
jgi:hypothetical protein